MSDSESDEDLKRAIALSLAEESSASQTHVAAVIDLISSDEDDDLDAPVTARNTTSTKPPSQKKDERSRDVSTAGTEDATKPSIRADSSASGPATSGGFLGLNRKQMEEERLQRANQRNLAGKTSTPEPEAKKRKAGSSPPRSQEQDPRHVRTKLSMPTTASSAARSALHIMSFQDANRALTTSGVQFPDGVVKKTWVRGCPRHDDIKIEEVLQKADLELAVLSAFQVDPDWVVSKLGPATKVVWVLQAKTEAEVRLWKFPFM